MPKEIWGYARVSTKEQNLDRQLIELRQYVKKEENIFSDKQSGKDFNRDAYQKLKAVARSGDEIYVKNIYRLGRNKEMIKDELQYFKNKGIHVHILNFPQTMIAVEDEHQKSIMELVTDLLIDVFSFMAEEERKNIRARQAEGIDVWRKTGKTKTGRPYGRPRTPFPKDWKTIYDIWKETDFQSQKAWKALGISKNTFYKLVKEYEQNTAESTKTKQKNAACSC